MPGNAPIERPVTRGSISASNAAAPSSNQFEPSGKSKQGQTKEITNNQIFDLINEKFDKIASEMESMRNSLEEAREENEMLRNTVKQLAMKVDDLENRSRRDNVVFHGIEEKETFEPETWEESEEKIVKFLKDDLKLEGLNIERAHRIGRRQRGKNRPIIAKLSSKDKRTVMSKKKDIVSETIYVSEDFSAKVRKARKELYAFSNEHNMEKASIQYNKLYWRGKQFIYDEDEDCVIEVLQNRPRNY